MKCKARFDWELRNLAAKGSLLLLLAVPFHAAAQRTYPGRGAVSAQDLES